MGLRVGFLAAIFVLLTSVDAVSAELDRESFSLVGEALVEVGPFDLDVYRARHFTRNANETLVELTYLRTSPDIYPSRVGIEVSNTSSLPQI